jgi:hypothetical protein
MAVTRSQMPVQMTKAPKNPVLAAKRPNKAMPKPMPFKKGGMAKCYSKGGKVK